MTTKANYECFVRQQPSAARACGNAEKPDRRPIDPVVVIQLRCDGLTEVRPDVYNARLICYATLLDPTIERPVVPEAHGQQRILPTLTGTILASISHLRDPEKESCRGAYFVFSDLNVRSEGSYRLRFDIYHVGNKTSEHVSQCTTNIFTVYSAKRFPGMSQSTELSQMFADQGLKIRIRRDMRLRKKQKAQGAQHSNAVVPLLPYAKPAGSSRARYDASLFDTQPDNRPSNYSHSASFSSSCGSITTPSPGFQPAETQQFVANNKRFVPAYSSAGPTQAWPVPTNNTNRMSFNVQPAQDYVYGRNSATNTYQYGGSMPYGADAQLSSGVYSVWPDYNAGATPTQPTFPVPQANGRGMQAGQQQQQQQQQQQIMPAQYGLVAAGQSASGYLPQQPQQAPQQQPEQAHAQYVPQADGLKHEHAAAAAYGQMHSAQQASLDAAAAAAAANDLGALQAYGRPALPPLQSILHQGQTREARAA